MARRVSKDTIKRKTIEEMKALGVYKPQFNRLIEIYAELIHQYTILSCEFEKAGYPYEAPTNQGGMKRAPIVGTLEGLRKDILAYADRLCLNPKAIGNASLKDRVSPLAAVLRDLEA